MPQEMMIIIINWIFGLIGLLCMLAIIIGFPGFIIAIIAESVKQVPDKQKRSYRFSKIFGISFAIGLIVLIAVMVLWGISTYLVMK